MVIIDELRNDIVQYINFGLRQVNLRYDESGLLTPDTGNKEKNWANMMIGLMDACKLSVFGLNELAENATGSDIPIVSISVFKLSNFPNFELLLGDTNALVFSSSFTVSSIPYYYSIPYT